MIRVIESFEKRDDGGFAATGRADEGDKLAAFNTNIEVPESGCIARWILKGDIFEFDVGFK